MTTAKRTRKPKAEPEPAPELPAEPAPEPIAPHYADDLATLYLGDSLKVMAQLEPDSIDAVVTDPPYGLEFMGKEWDKFRIDPRAARWSGENSGGAGAGFGVRVDDGRETRLPSFHSRRTTGRCKTCGKRDAFRNPHKCGEAADWEIIPVDVVPIEARAFGEWCRLWAVEAYRITRPGGYMLAFGGTRTHHRLVVGIEDAGWIIRDELDWIYASGFPKSRASLKPAREPIVLARKPGLARNLNIDANRLPISAEDAALIDGAGGYMKAGWQGPDTGIYNKSGDPTVGSTPRSIGPTTLSQQNKPARASLAARDAPNVDALPPKGDRDNIIYGHGLGIPDPDAAVGRWPSNVLLSDPELFDEPNPYVIGSGSSNPGGDYNNGAEYRTGGYTSPGYGDSGGPARFFLVPKADRNDREPVVRGQLERQAGAGGIGWANDDWTVAQRAERDFPGADPFAAFPDNPRCRKCDRQRIGALGAPPCECPDPDWAPPGPVRPRENMHPTVKPTDLMRHLVRLVTPPGGVVLDPFLGSGSTLIAANAEGYRAIGIELDPESMAIARARMSGFELGLGLDVPAPSKPPAKPAKFTGQRHGGDYWTDKLWGQDDEPPAEEPA